MSSTIATAAAPNRPFSADLVPEDRRMDFMPALFMHHLMMRGEHTIYSIMDELSLDYDGGFWDFLELGGHPLYMRPQSPKQFRLSWPGNGFEGTGSADAAGIIACLLAFSYLSEVAKSDRMLEAFHRLRRFAYDHPEANTILNAID